MITAVLLHSYQSTLLTHWHTHFLTWRLIDLHRLFEILCEGRFEVGSWKGCCFGRFSSKLKTKNEKNRETMIFDTEYLTWWRREFMINSQSRARLQHYCCIPLLIIACLIADAGRASLCPTPPLTTRMRPIATTTLLLLVDQVAAFVPNGRAGSLNQRMPTSISTSEALNSPTSINNYSNYSPRVRLSGLRGLSLSSGNGTPSWRYEVDDLIKAASPWGSLVETEIIATDLLKVIFKSL